jgi:tetratricopeptide (TPR) repeat protein
MATLVTLRKRRPAPAAEAEPVTGPHREWRWTAWAQSAAMLAASLVAFPLMRASNAEQYSLIGGGLALADKRDAAIDCLRKALDLTPENAIAWLNLGTVLGNTGHREEAVRYIERSLQIDPNSARGVSNLAVLKLGRGEAEAALALLRRAVMLQPTDAEPHFNMGRALLSLSRVDEAAVHLDRSVELAAGSVGSYQRVGRLWTEFSEYERALAVLRLGVERLPRSAVLTDELASLLAACPEHRLRDGAEAVRLSEFSNALTGRRDPFKLRTLAAAYGQAGDNARAIEAARASLARARELGETGLAAEVTTALRAMGESPGP